MKPKAFAALAVITLMAFSLALITFGSQTRLAQVRNSGEPLFPGLSKQAGQITKIELQQGDKKIALARDKDSWSLADRAGYPAKSETVRGLLSRLAQAQLVEAKTRSKDRYGLLELEDPAGKDAKSHLVRLLDDKGGVLAEAVVGKKRSDAFGAARAGTYVRKPADAQTWLANAEINVPIAVRDWVQPAVLDIPAAKIASVSIEIAGEEPLKLTRETADASKHALVDMPEGKKLKDGAAISAIVRAAGSIELEDVRKPAATPAGENAGTAKLEADGGLAVALQVRKEGEAYWLTIEATGAEGDAKKAAEEITARTKGWEYKIPAAKVQSILKRRADLFEAS